MKSMQKPGKPSTDHDNLLLPRMGELRTRLAKADPLQLSRNAGSEFTPLSPGTGEFHLLFWEKEICLNFPGLIAQDRLTGKDLGIANQAMLLYYFATADGTPLSNQWISFTDLPDGKFYSQAFQGYTGMELFRHFGNNLALFVEAAHNSGGGDYPFGDAAFVFRVLPRILLLLVCWQGDDEFPASYQILFDASASHYLPTDACAIAGSMLTRKLLSSTHNQTKPT
jgi:hypothetical protein